MTPKNFVYLAAAAAVSVLLAIVSFASNNQWSTGQAAGEKLLRTAYCFRGETVRFLSNGCGQTEQTSSIRDPGNPYRTLSGPECKFPI